MSQGRSGARTPASWRRPLSPTDDVPRQGFAGVFPVLVDMSLILATSRLANCAAPSTILSIASYVAGANLSVAVLFKLPIDIRPPVINIASEGKIRAATLTIAIEAIIAISGALKNQRK